MWAYLVHGENTINEITVNRIKLDLGLVIRNGFADSKHIRYLDYKRYNELLFIMNISTTAKNEFQPTPMTQNFEVVNVGIKRQGQMKCRIEIVDYASTVLGAVGVCEFCIGLIKTGALGYDQAPEHHITGRPLIEKIWYMPHVCTLDMLKRIEKLKMMGWIDEQVYESWMQINTGNYQLGSNEALLELWKDRWNCNSGAGPRPTQGSTEPAYIGRTKPGYRLKYCNHRRPHKHAVIMWNLVKSRENLKHLNQLYPFSSDADKTHTSVDVASLLYKLKSSKYFADESNAQQQRANDILALLPIGAPNITVCAWLIAGLGLSNFAKSMELVKMDRTCGLRVGEYREYWKAVSTAVRRTSRWVDGTLCSLSAVVENSYIEMPIGRSVNVSDWKDERIKRTAEYVPLRLPNVTEAASAKTNEDYCQVLELILDQVMAELVTTGDVWGSWEQHVLTRQQWVSAGSSGGAKFLIGDKWERLNKQAYFETISNEEMIEWLSHEPKIEAMASEKFEMGKNRAIYGTKPKDYAIMSYVIAKAEKSLWRIEGVESGISGLDEMLGIARRAHVVSTGTVECTMVDYADFNYQHTLLAQSIVFKAMKNRLSATGKHEDVIRAAEWCEKALLNQWCRFPQRDDIQKITQGMFSGVRGTNFINTILNVAYVRLATVHVKEMLDLVPCRLYSIHQGDDVWLTNQSRLWATGLYHVMQHSGLVFQPGKQMFDINRGEFLRVVYTDQGARGYPLRAIGSLIISPLQSTEMHAPADRARGLTSQIHLLYRRGVSKEVCSWLWDTIVPHKLHLALPGSSGVTIPTRVAQAPIRRGGLDLGPPETGAVNTVNIPVLPRMQVLTQEMEATIPKEMSEAWIHLLSGAIKREMRTERVIQSLHAANISGSARLQDRKLGLRQHEKDIQKWKQNLFLPPDQPMGRQELPCVLTTSVGMITRIERGLTALERPLSHKVHWEDRGAMDTILAAIASCPFKDVNTIQQALNMSLCEAAKYAINLCPGDGLRIAASLIVHGIEEACGKAVLTRILSGVGGVSSSWECKFTPVVLSWLSKVAADIAISYAIWNQVRTPDGWDDLLDEVRGKVITMALQDGRLFALSHF